MFDPLGKHPECKRLGMTNGGLFSCTIREHPRKLGNLGNPAAVHVLLCFKGDIHGGRISHPCPKTNAPENRVSGARSGEWEAYFFFAALIAFSTRGGDIGMWLRRTPAAFEIALAMAPSGGTIEVSPTPRTP